MWCLKFMCEAPRLADGGPSLQATRGPPQRACTRSDAARPNTSGEYISSAVAGGAVKSPVAVTAATYVYVYDPGERCPCPTAWRLAVAGC